MSVLSCDVNGCRNIMCSRFSWKLQKYICDDCHKRLVSRGILNREDIEKFFEEEEPLSMASDPDTYYREIFPIKD